MRLTPATDIETLRYIASNLEKNNGLSLYDRAILMKLYHKVQPNKRIGHSLSCCRRAVSDLKKLNLL